MTPQTSPLPDRAPAAPIRRTPAGRSGTASTRRPSDARGPLRPPLARRARRDRGARGHRHLRMVARRRRDRAGRRRGAAADRRGRAACSSRSRPPGRRREPAAGMDAPGTATFAPTAGLPVRARLIAGPPADASLVPAALRSQLPAVLPEPRRARLAGLPAWTYGPIDDGKRVLELTVAATAAGVLAVECSASPATWSAALGCETGVRSIGSTGGKAARPGARPRVPPARLRGDPHARRQARRRPRRARPRSPRRGREPPRRARTARRPPRSRRSPLPASRPTRSPRCAARLPATTRSRQANGARPASSPPARPSCAPRRASPAR